MTGFDCGECGVHLKTVRVWPVTCACGITHDEDGTRKMPRTGLGDVVSDALALVGIRKRRGCKCSQRQRWLNLKLNWRKRDLTAKKK